MSTPTEGGRALLRGRVLGFPVHLDLSFVLIVALLGYSSGTTLRFWLLWLLIAPLAILVHELGHAVAARAFGSSTPRIALVGFGGLTTFIPPARLSRARSLVISLAGPFVGLMFGLLALLVDLVVLPRLDPFGWQADAVWIVELTCGGWSLLNLLPVLPLDGGQAMRELLPGSEAVRGRRAAMVSVVTAAVVGLAVLLFLPGQPFLGLFMLFFCLTNILALRDSRPADPAAQGSPAGAVVAGPEQAVVALLWRSDATGARRLMESLPAGTEVDLAVHGAVLSLTGEPAQGHALLLQEVTRRPGDPNAAALLLLTQALEHDWDAVLATLQGPAGRSVPPAVVERAVQEARFTGREDVAGRITVLAPTAAPVPPGPPPQTPPGTGPA